MTLDFQRAAQLDRQALFHPLVIERHEIDELVSKFKAGLEAIAKEIL